MARKNKNKDIQKAEMPKAPERRPFDEDTLDFVELEVYRKEKGELHEQDPRKPINAEGGGGPERLDLLKRLSVFRGKGDTPVKKAAKGGSMSKQMEMFEDGGLKDEGGMTDEVSGNDVPIGSTREEVRDDIPAQLSEGEFVFPADVVRFMGLEKLMMLRQKAKEGLKKMEDMGQMGNSEEATLPDDMPFDMDDLNMEDDKEEEVADSNFNRGGVVTMAEGGTTPTTENTDLNVRQTGVPTRASVGTNSNNLNVKQTGVPTRASVGTNSTNLNVKQTNVPTRASVGTNSTNLNVKQTGVPTRGNTNATPTDTSLNARQTNVPTTRPTNLVGTDTTSTTDTKSIDFRSFVPKDLGNRYQNKIQSVVDDREAARAEAQKNYDDALNQDIFKSPDIPSEVDGDNDNTASPSSGLDLGGNIEHSLTDYTALNDNLKDVHKDFTKAQYDMLAPAFSMNPFGLAASAIGLKFSEQTKGATYFGAVGAAELGKAKATAYNMAAIEVQREYGLLNNNTISTWSDKAQDRLADKAKGLMSFVTDVHNSKYGIEVPNEEEKPNAYSNAINTAKGYYSKAFGKVTAPIASVKITELPTTTSKNATKAYMQQVMELARNSLEDKAREAEEEKNTVSYGFDDVSITAELSDYGFNVSARDSINVNGGLKSYGFDVNGNRFGVTVNGNVVNQLGKMSNVRAFITLPQVQSAGVGKGQTTKGGAFGLDPTEPSYGSITDFGKAMNASGKSGYYGSIGQAINDVNDKTGKIGVERATKAFNLLSILGINPLNPTAEAGITTPNNPNAASYGIDTNPGKDTDPMGNPTDVPSGPTGGIGANTGSSQTDSTPGSDDNPDASENSESGTGDAEAMGDDGGMGPTAKGGLVNKRKLKQKKMKRGGLASRK